jgi:O-antigen ligase
MLTGTGRVAGIVLVSVVFGWASAHGLAKLGLGLVAATLVFLFIVRKRSNGLVLGAFLAIALPYSMTFGVPQLGAVRLTALIALAVVLVIAVDRGDVAFRIHWVDVVVASFILLAFVSWLLSPTVHGALGATINSVTPLSFYLVARVVGREAETRLPVFLLAGGAFAAATIVWEMLVAHRPLFSNADSYLWSATGTSFFRPSGVFGSPPGGSTILGMIALLALPLAVGGARWRKLALVGIAACVLGDVLTFTRGPLIGLIVGCVVYVLLVSPQPRTVISMLAVALVVPFVIVSFVLPSVGQSRRFEEAFVRHGNFAARQTYWREALPRVTNSPHHLLLGHGINSLVIGRSWLPGPLDPDVASSPTLFAYGTHSQYVRELFDEGVIGLLLFVGWFGGAAFVGIGWARRTPAPDRPQMASYVGAVACFMTAAVATDIARHPVALTVASLATGMLVSRRQTVIRESDA